MNERWDENIQKRGIKRKNGINSEENWTRILKY